MTPQQIEKMYEFVAYYANCPCCKKSDKCVAGCTFECDDPAAHDVMLQAREALEVKQ